MLGRLGRKHKHFIAVVAAQVACVAVGLWVQHRFLASSTRRAVALQAWSDIAQAAETAREAVPKSAHKDATADRIRTAFSSATHDAPQSCGVVVTDADWRLIAHIPAEGEADAMVSDQVSWMPDERPMVEVASAEAGGVEVGGVRRSAAMFSAWAGGDRVVVYLSGRGSVVPPATILGSLAGISVVTLFWTCGLMSIGVYLLLSRFHDESQREREQADATSLKRIQTLARTRDAVIFGLAKLADSRDPETGDHLERIAYYASRLATALRHHPKYRDAVTPTFARLIGVSSALHDIGKVGIEDAILLKPGRLTDQERERMQEHALIGAECLEQIENRLGSSNFLEMAREIAVAHHERWDGKGYPHGLKGEDIPLSARIIAIADVYDALSSRRVYKPPMPHERCVEIITGDAGSHFDPDLVEVWLTVAEQFRDIALQYASQPPVCDESKARDKSELVASDV